MSIIPRATRQWAMSGNRLHQLGNSMAIPLGFIRQFQVRQKEPAAGGAVLLRLPRLESVF